MTAGGASASGTPLYRHPLSLARGSRAKSPYFGGVSRGGKAELVFLDPRFRKDDGRGCVSVRDNLSRTVVPPLPSPLGLTRGSRAMSPYFCEVSRGGKAALVFLDPRFRKDDHRRGVVGGDNIPHSPIKTTC